MAEHFQLDTVNPVNPQSVDVMGFAEMDAEVLRLGKQLLTTPEFDPETLLTDMSAVLRPQDVISLFQEFQPATRPNNWEGELVLRMALMLMRLVHPKPLDKIANFQKLLLTSQLNYPVKLKLLADWFARMRQVWPTKEAAETLLETIGDEVFMRTLELRPENLPLSAPLTSDDVAGDDVAAAKRAEAIEGDLANHREILKMIDARFPGPLPEPMAVVAYLQSMSMEHYRPAGEADNQEGRIELINYAEKLIADLKVIRAHFDSLVGQINTALSENTDMVDSLLKQAAEEESGSMQAVAKQGLQQLKIKLLPGMEEFAARAYYQALGDYTHQGRIISVSGQPSLKPAA